jgi:hypothetical protein
LKNQNFAALADLERLLKVLEYNANDSKLLGVLKKGLENGRAIRSLKKMEELMAPVHFTKLMREIKFK